MTKKPNQSENYYSLLNCDQSASYEELKQNYQELIRKYHPDKCDGCQETFLNIDKAWKVLKDEESRKKYDIYLQTQMDSDNVVVYAEITKNDLDFDNEVARYPCRCGNDFLIQKDDIGEECLVECDECSNCILIKQS